MPPAARLGDNHTCPLVDPGPKPHVGGPVVSGAPNVLINGIPAARIGDACTCIGPPDAITGGSTRVIIAGSPAARLGDRTAHGGQVAAGSANVIIN